MRPETVTESEIHAYLDGELDLNRRLAVERHLSEDPAAASLFMAEQQMRTALRLISEEAGDPPAPMREAAARLTARLATRQPRGLRLIFGAPVGRSLAAAAMLALIAIPARNVMASRPDYVASAVEAYHTGLLRAAMVSQVETPRFDAGEIRRSTKIRIPRLPAKWIVTDAQIFPSADGPALQLMIRTPDAEQLSVFAVRTPSDAPEQPTATRHDGASVAYWREGDMSYALTGSGKPEDLDMVAENIAAEATS